MFGFYATIDPDNMYVSITACKDKTDMIFTQYELEEFLKTNNICKGIKYDIIAQAFAELDHLPAEKEYIIARGHSPADGEDGTLIFKFNTSQKPYYDTNDCREGENVDYKEATKITQVNTGEELIEIIPPTRGINGFTVKGVILPAHDGKGARVTLGKGVYYNEGQNKILSSQNGRPIFKNNRISVIAIYEIKGDVDYTTGNIHFNGHVRITGSIQDNFQVDATSAEIHGTVGKAAIRTENDLTISGGVNGHESTHIFCNGNAYIKYINEAAIECKGDLHVDKIIINSNIKCLGTVTADTIVGGKTTALKGVHVNTLGSQMGTTTSIECGINFEILTLNIAIQNLSWNITSLLSKIAQHLGDRSFFKKLNPEKQKSIVETYQIFSRIKKGYLNLLQRRNALVNDRRLSPYVEIIVFKHLFSDIVIRTPLCYKEFFQEFLGPIQLIEELEKRSIRIIEYSTKTTKQLHDLMNCYSDSCLISCNTRLNYAENKQTINIIYSEKKLLSISAKFTNMIYGQNFHILVLEENNRVRMNIINGLHNIGIENAIGISSEKSLLSVFEKYEEKKVVLICNLQFSGNKGLNILSEYLHHSGNRFAIIVSKYKNRKLENAIENIKPIRLITGYFDIRKAIEFLHEFNINF